jgi:hypothetical protein
MNADSPPIDLVSFCAASSSVSLRRMSFVGTIMSESSPRTMRDATWAAVDAAATLGLTLWVPKTSSGLTPRACTRR